MATETAASAPPPGLLVDVCSVESLQAQGRTVVTAGGRRVLLLMERGEVYALDNRCPHMGFPLHRGTVKDGILTCHWHHAKFDLAGGCTFDPWADDVTAFRVEVRDGRVLIDPRPVESDPREHWGRKLDEGLEQNLTLVLAKAVIGLDAVHDDAEVVRRAALFGLRNRASGWSSGLSVLTAMANVLPHLDPVDRARALFHGVVDVARRTAGQPPSFDLSPLETNERRPERYLEWFRRFVEVRAGDAAERTLRTAIHLGLPQQAIAGMVFAACTDHLFLDVGHTLDFANKAFELLDHIGWRHAGEVLPSLVPELVGARRMEETSAWRHPVDLADLISALHEELDALIDQGGQARDRWDGHRELAESILDDEPATILDAMRELLRAGVPLVELSAAVAYAAARRPVHFPTSNEHGDWDTVHHTFTYANAVDQALRRNATRHDEGSGPRGTDGDAAAHASASRLLARGIFDGAMSVHLERFLNVPKRPIPAPSRAPEPEELLRLLDVHGGVDEVGAAVAGLTASGHAVEAVRTLGHALLRENATFHEYQMYEAGVRQHQRFADRPEGGHILVGVARFLAAQWPTVRSRQQTFDIARRLQRGEAIHEDAE